MSLYFICKWGLAAQGTEDCVRQYCWWWLVTTRSYCDINLLLSCVCFQSPVICYCSSSIMQIQNYFLNIVSISRCRCRVCRDQLFRFISNYLVQIRIVFPSSSPFCREKSLLEASDMNVQTDKTDKTDNVLSPSCTGRAVTWHVLLQSAVWPDPPDLSRPEDVWVYQQNISLHLYLPRPGLE